ncbi:MAG: amidase [Alphaproteobacteria bacterium]
MAEATLALCDLSATELRRLIGAKQLSPVELLDACLARAAQINRQVNGIVAVDEARARREAKEAEAAVMRGDALGPLHGLPMGIKDLVDTAGLRTTYGSPVFAQHVPDRDERFVANLRRAGAIVCWKTNTPEWGAGGNTFNLVYGVSGNPFDPSLTCGGSSGGSAIALATGMLALCHGSDNAGSLRIPAAYCGVVGMRPTAGRVPSERRPTGLSHLMAEGPMARTARDTLMLLCAMAEDNWHDALATPRDPSLVPNPPELDLSTLRLAYSADLGGFAQIEPSIRDVFARRIAAFRGAFRIAAEASPTFDGADRAYEVLRAVNFAGIWTDRFREHPGQWGRLVGENLAAAARFTVADVGAALVRHTAIYQAAQDFFADFDLLITPTVGIAPWPKHRIYPSAVGGAASANYFDWVRITYAITLINHPSISIPCGVDDRGLPFGLHIVGPRHGDAFVLRAAIALEELFARQPELGRPRPDITWLLAQPADDPLGRPVT